MQELWLSFIGALIRFWDNRFLQSSCHACNILQEENARLRAENSKLMNLVLAPVSPAVETPSAINFEPIHQIRSWNSKRAELERQHSGQTAGTKKITVEDLEKDLAELEKV